jgi:hypothetical protein
MGFLSDRIQVMPVQCRGINQCKISNLIFALEKVQFKGRLDTPGARFESSSLQADLQNSAINLLRLPLNQMRFPSEGPTIGLSNSAQQAVAVYLAAPCVL